VLCVPQKNGNVDFGLLVYRVHYGLVPDDPMAADIRLKHAGLSFSVVGMTDEVFLVARNPFTRMLSLYLDKVLRCFSTAPRMLSLYETSCQHDLLATSGAFNFSAPRTPRAAPTFTVFVALVKAAAEENGDVCALDHHLCKQVQGCPIDAGASLRVLKLEDEVSWFSCLAHALGLTDAELRGNQWCRWKHRPCFFGICSSSSEAVEEPVAGSVHATGATGRVAEFYDATAAAAVRVLYADDFRLLGYLWDLPT
jgi:hypothetical protein